MSEKQYHIHTTQEDVAPYVLLPGDPHRVELVAALWDEAHFVADNREHITYTGVYRGMPITCTSTGMGCPSTAIAMEELARCGAQTFLRMGTCVGICPQVQRGHFVIFDSACRFEGTTRCYAPLEYPAAAHYEVVQAAVSYAREANLTYHVGTSRCIDGLYTNRPDANTSFGGYRLHQWDTFLQDLQAMNVIAGDMESAVVMVLSRLFGLRGGAVCMCAANLMSAYESGGELNINQIGYGGDLIDQLNHAALEVMYRIYLKDQQKKPL